MRVSTRNQFVIYQQVNPILMVSLLTLSILILLIFNKAYANNWHMLVDGNAVPVSHYFEEKDSVSYSQFNNTNLSSEYHSKLFNEGGTKDLSGLSSGYYRVNGIIRRVYLNHYLSDLHVDMGMLGFVVYPNNHIDEQPIISMLPMFAVTVGKLAVSFAYSAEDSDIFVEPLSLYIKVSQRRFW